MSWYRLIKPAAILDRPSEPSEHVRTLMRTCPCSLPTLETQAAVSEAAPASFFVTWQEDREKERGFQKLMSVCVCARRQTELWCKI